MSSQRKFPNTEAQGMGEAVKGITMAATASKQWLWGVAGPTQRRLGEGSGSQPCGPMASPVDTAGRKIPSTGHPVTLAFSLSYSPEAPVAEPWHSGTQPFHPHLSSQKGYHSLAPLTSLPAHPSPIKTLPDLPTPIALVKAPGCTLCECQPASFMAQGLALKPVCWL